jgi:hypothetical protein
MSVGAPPVPYQLYLVGTDRCAMHLVQLGRFRIIPLVPMSLTISNVDSRAIMRGRGRAPRLRSRRRSARRASR